MTEQTKTGDVGHRFDAVDIGKCRARQVHLAHHFRGKTDMFWLKQGFFLRSREHTNPQRFGEEKFAAFLRGTVALHALGRHHAGDGEAEDRFWRVDGVSTRQRDARLLAGKATAFDHFACNFWWNSVDWPAENGDRHNRFTAHREDVADGVGRRDTPEIKRVIDNGHKEVSGADDAGAIT
ncbi:hypothetical protein D3C87_1553160 [compost metagenome]